MPYAHQVLVEGHDVCITPTDIADGVLELWQEILEGTSFDLSLRPYVGDVSTADIAEVRVPAK